MIRLVLADGSVLPHTKLHNLSLAAHSVSDVGTFFGGGHSGTCQDLVSPRLYPADRRRNFLALSRATIYLPCYLRDNIAGLGGMWRNGNSMNSPCPVLTNRVSHPTPWDILGVGCLRRTRKCIHVCIKNWWRSSGSLSEPDKEFSWLSKSPIPFGPLRIRIKDCMGFSSRLIGVGSKPGSSSKRIGNERPPLSNWGNDLWTMDETNKWSDQWRAPAVEPRVV